MFLPQFWPRDHAQTSLGRNNFLRVKSSPFWKLKVDLETRQDKLSNEISWAQFEHREDLQKWSAKRRYTLGRRCTLGCEASKPLKNHLQSLPFPHVTSYQVSRSSFQLKLGFTSIFGGLFNKNTQSFQCETQTCTNTKNYVT